MAVKRGEGDFTQVYRPCKLSEVVGTETYREEMDVLADFLKDRCMEVSLAKTPSKDLYGAYTAWCEENGQKPVCSRTFGSGLRERGFKPIRFSGLRGWEGIALV